MGLNIVVGALVDAEDDDYTEMVRADFVAIGELLERAGARQWTEPILDEEDGAEFEAWGYTGLHTLRRLAVHLAADGHLPEPLDGSQWATDDPLLGKVYEALPSDPPGPFDHLVHHSDCEGYYVPVDFAHVIVDKKAPGGYLGSSVRLLEETRRLAEALGLPEDLDPDSEEVFDAADTENPAAEGWQRYRVESYMCLQLLHAAKHSISTGAAIAFC
ncbi:hypothetical protein E2C00_00610 [Streptomyces sp. WAC05374]|uniref:hypothetical protein n=1 Tax=Streptomyces sp. WAC05374 TaxID=2487420 RepID=UPI000F89BB91|nr:hypothetical protein [Streptomyces sp. WAC05374]RST19591.1 hypothetical protein EF905_00335 [Streptomyces sp. WAC05374]TDF50072.1 hypothetical protein E2B92_00585 [Streptomyces sp. WAC05374]TDF57798.1 hypothetical protein E2C02_08375 [Streptomyces sp. WAC05374]TDF60326.1 hypothetical protein E2C00_00610 [Streptomyces sp. WAC05374]